MALQGSHCISGTLYLPFKEKSENFTECKIFAIASFGPDVNSVRACQHLDTLHSSIYIRVDATNLKIRKSLPISFPIHRWTMAVVASSSWKRKMMTRFSYRNFSIRVGSLASHIMGILADE